MTGHANGTGELARFSQPWDVVYSNGDLLVSEVDNGDLRRVTLAGLVSDVVPPGTLDEPQGIAVDPIGNIYVTEYGTSHDIKKITASTVTPYAGSTVGYLDSDDPQAAQFYGVEGIDITRDGSLLVVADGNHGDSMPFNHIRVIHQ